MLPSDFSTAATSRRAFSSAARAVAVSERDVMT